jgi:hypothetical protein
MLGRCTNAPKTCDLLLDAPLCDLPKMPLHKGLPKKLPYLINCLTVSVLVRTPCVTPLFSPSKWL